MVGCRMQKGGEATGIGSSLQEACKQFNKAFADYNNKYNN